MSSHGLAFTGNCAIAAPIDRRAFPDDPERQSDTEQRSVFHPVGVETCGQACS